VVLRRAANARLDHLGVTGGSDSGSCSSPQPSTRSFVACSTSTVVGVRRLQNWYLAPAVGGR
jgi:hypothetical protein